MLFCGDSTQLSGCYVPHTNPKSGPMYLEFSQVLGPVHIELLEQLLPCQAHKFGWNQGWSDSRRWYGIAGVSARSCYGKETKRLGSCMVF